MASGLIRWPALAGLLALGAAAIIYRSAPTGTEGSGLSAERQRLSSELTQVRSRIIDAEVASGLRERAVAFDPSRDGLHLIALDSVSRLHPLDPAIRTAFGSAWGRLSRRDSSVATTVVVARRSVIERVFHPAAGQASGCIAWTWWWTWWNEREAANTIGPCAYYAEFGAPGPGVGAWFVSSAVGQISRPPQSNRGNTVWRFWEDPHQVEDPASWSFRLLRQPIPPYFASPDAAACVGAASPRCTAALLRPVAHATSERSWWYWGGDRGLAGFEEVLLPRLLVQFGSERFSAFWHSTKPVPAAFEQAFGLPLDQWLHGELADYLGPLELGAGDLKDASVSVLVWVLVLGFVTAGLARKLKY